MHGGPQELDLEARLQVAAQQVEATLGCGPAQLSSAAQGANSRIYLATTPAGRCAVKLYGSAGTPGRARLETEWRALSLLASGGVHGAPHPLARHDEASLALLSWAPGRLLTSSEIRPQHIHEVVAFVGRLQGLHAQARVSGVTDAAEACFCFADHLHLVEQRLARLTQALVGQQRAPAQAALQWLTQHLRPALARCAVTMQQVAQRTGQAWAEPLARASRVLSPSDIGFHNLLVDEVEGMTFIDWEYFGWDDPGKTLSDLLLHPDRAMPAACLPTLVGSLQARAGATAEGGWGDRALRRAHVLMPLLGIKWCLIMLNPFLRLPPAGQLGSPASSTASTSSAASPSSMAARGIDQAGELLQARLEATQRYFAGVTVRLQEPALGFAYP
jgi:Phosphotransferase enzyme family